MNAKFREEGNQIILRAAADAAPGYLRGKAYTAYNFGKWIPKPAESAIKMNSKSYEGILVYKTFFLGERSADYPARQDIIYDNNFKSDFLLVPGNYSQIELVSERLNCDINGVLRPDEWEKDGGYTVFMKNNEEESAFNGGKLDSPEKNPEYLAVPGNLIPVLDKVIGEISDPQDPIYPKMTGEKIEALQKYFHKNFKYDLDFAMDENFSDPLEYFLSERKRGHCELYASSAVILARRLGIPARYITGFLCFERHPSGKYFVSRLENAHAWAELYSKEEGRWLLLELTPPAGIPRSASNPDWGFFRQYSDSILRMMQSILSDVRRGFFAKAVLQILLSIYDVAKMLSWHPLRGP
jgi:transglutaminase-like putative cysteine protease